MQAGFLPTLNAELLSYSKPKVFGREGWIIEFEKHVIILGGQNKACVAA